MLESKSLIIEDLKQFILTNAQDPKICKVAVALLMFLENPKNISISLTRTEKEMLLKDGVLVNFSERVRGLSDQSINIFSFLSPESTEGNSSMRRSTR